MVLRMVGQTIIFVALLGFCLFLPAGTPTWPQAWIAIGLIGGCSLAVGLWLARANPSLLVERMKLPVSAEQMSWDRILMGAIAPGFFVWFVVMALDARRFRWSGTPLWVQVFGAALMLMAFYVNYRVFAENSFAVPVVRLQEERGQTVISTGPYAIVRHPLYSAALAFFIGMPFLLGSLWGLIGAVAMIPIFAARARGEEAMLMAGLPGYRDYAAKVRFRLVPGLW